MAMLACTTDSGELPPFLVLNKGTCGPKKISILLNNADTWFCLCFLWPSYVLLQILKNQSRESTRKSQKNAIKELAVACESANLPEFSAQRFGCTALPTFELLRGCRPNLLSKPALAAPHSCLK